MTNARFHSMSEEMAAFLLNGVEKPFRVPEGFHGLWDYEMKRIAEVADNFDDTGALLLVHLASLCRRLVGNVYAPVRDVLSLPDALDPFKRIMALVDSPEVRECRETLARVLCAAVGSASKQRLLGDEESIFPAMDDAIKAIFGGFRHLRYEAYAISGRPVESTGHTSTSVLSFGSLAECLLALERAKDGIYICFISNPGTLDGWFGFFAKSNGNIFSYNERIDEAYAGQHRRMRNGRYAEEKAYDLFPYEMCEFSDDRDYKGYSTEMHIGEDLDLVDAAGENRAVFTRALLSMALIMRRHEGRPLDGEPVVVNSLLPRNLLRAKEAAGESKEAETALVKLGSSEIVARTAAFDSPDFDVAKMLRGEYDKEFDGGSGLEYGVFKGVNQDMVDAYGEGFRLDSRRLLASDSSIRLIGKTSGDQEFIGSPRRLRKQAYYEARKQLALYIQRRMDEDFDAFGGSDGLREWYKKTLLGKMEEIRKLCADAYSRTGGEGEIEIGVPEKQDHPTGSKFDAENPPVRVFVSGKRMYAGVNLCEHRDNSLVCPISHTKATVYFRVRFFTYRQVQRFIGCDLPKFCVGWGDHRPYNGNSILDITDPVGDLSGPLQRNYFSFDFVVAFSKRALKNKEKSK